MLSPFGFHIIKLLERRSGKILSFDDAKERIKGKLYNEEMERGITNLIEDLKERRDKKSKEFDERYMDLVMDYQDLKIYAMKLEEQLGIRHTPPKPLSQRG